MSDTEDVHEKVLASALLSEAAGKCSASLDSFSSWLLGGFAAALVFLISNVGSLQAHLPVIALRAAGRLFLIAVVLGLVEKYIATVLRGAAEASAAGREIGEKFAEFDLDFKIVFGELEKAMFPPLKWFVRRSLAKAQSGDFAASARSFVKWAQIQGFVVVVQAAVLLWAVYRLLSDLVT